MANIMKDVAKLLGLELEEEFTIEGFEDFFPKVKLTERGLSYWSNIDRRWCSLGDIPTKLLTGENKITNFLIDFFGLASLYTTPTYNAT